jgi:hypothetical protein
MLTDNKILCGVITSDEMIKSVTKQTDMEQLPSEGVNSESDELKK